jgi:hypothetical protein
MLKNFYQSYSQLLAHRFSLNSFLSILASSLLALPANNAKAAPSDFDGDGFSNPTTVTIVSSERLKWNIQGLAGEQELVGNFGKPGVHLMPGRYFSGGFSSPAFVSSDGTWNIDNLTQDVVITHGEAGATYIGGADVNGDGFDDLVTVNNRCQAEPATARALVGVGGSQRVIEKRLKSGSFVTTYTDTNGDGRDELCSLVPEGSRKQRTGVFTLTCFDLVSNKRTARSRVGRIFDTPLPIKHPGSGDWLALPKQRGGSIKVRIVSTQGKIIRKQVPFVGTGILLVGNYTNRSGDIEQLALHQGSSLQVYDIASRSITSIPSPAGIAVDEININSFDNDLQSCLCTTEGIRNFGGQCPKVDRNGCINRAIEDGTDTGFLHKGVSDTTGSVVNLFPANERPEDCQYLRADGSLFQEAVFAGIGNPNRPHWRPAQGGSCRTFPRPLVVSCKVNGQRNCWTVPDPCARID